MTLLTTDHSRRAAHQVRATLLRKVSGSTDLSKTMRKAVRVLAEAGIPSLVVGGYAVQENGYARFTSDVNLVVPDVATAKAQLLINGFRENQGSSMTVTDRVSRIEVDLLPGGSSVGPGPLNLPIPALPASSTPTIADLRTLFEIKLSSYLGTPRTRIKDLADAVELIKANHLPREFEIAAEVQAEFLQSWDELRAEAER